MEYVGFFVMCEDVRPIHKNIEAIKVLFQKKIKRAYLSLLKW